MLLKSYWRKKDTNIISSTIKKEKNWNKKKTNRFMQRIWFFLAVGAHLAFLHSHRKLQVKSRKCSQPALFSRQRACSSWAHPSSGLHLSSKKEMSLFCSKLNATSTKCQGLLQAMEDTRQSNLDPALEEFDFSLPICSFTHHNLIWLLLPPVAQ